MCSWRETLMTHFPLAPSLPTRSDRVYAARYSARCDGGGKATGICVLQLLKDAGVAV